MGSARGATAERRWWGVYALALLAGVGVSDGAGRGRAQEPIGERIFGGLFARENEFPAQAYIRAYKYSPIQKRTTREYCGGSIISETWILTSGHCLKDSHTIFVGVGSSNRTKAKYLEVKRFILHEGLRLHGRHDNNAENDLGLLELREPLALDGVAVARARLPPTSSPAPAPAPAGRAAVVVGWGRRTYAPEKPGAESPQMLKKLDVRIIPCPDGLQNVICASSPEGEGICDGDSGGPLLAEGALWGVASYVDSADPAPLLRPNDHCTAAGAWAVFMAVPPHRAWIHQHSGV